MDSPAPRIGVYFLLLVVSAYVALFFALPLKSLLYGLPPAVQFPVTFAFEAFGSLVGLGLMLYFIEHRTFADAGFTLRGLVTETTIGAMIGMSVISATICAMIVAGVYTVYGQGTDFHPFAALLGYLFVAVAEETAFRGYLFRVLEYKYGSFIALMLSILLFALMHYFDADTRWMSGREHIGGSLMIATEFTLLMAAAYMATRRLWLPIGIHWAWYFFEGPIYGTDVSGYGADTTLLRAHVAGRFLLTGGMFGPEASIPCLIAAGIAGLLMLRVVIKSGQWHSAGEWAPQTLPKPERKAVKMPFDPLG